MRHLLFSTTALTALLALPLTAQAADKIKLGLGGYYRAVVAAGDQDDADDIREYGIGRESEVYFSGKTTMDNGLKVGAMIQLEGETSGDQIDNSYIWASGAFGRVEVGSTWGPSLVMSYGSVGDKLDGHSDFASQNHHKALGSVAGTGVFNNFAEAPSFNNENVLDVDGKVVSWHPGFERYVANDTDKTTSSILTLANYSETSILNTYGGDAGVSQNPDDKISYFSPRMGGIQLGLSYMPENYPSKDESGSALSSSTDGAGKNGSELVDVAVNYIGEFGGVSIAAFGSYFQATKEHDAETKYGHIDIYEFSGQVTKVGHNGDPLELLSPATGTATSVYVYGPKEDPIKKTVSGETETSFYDLATYKAGTETKTAVRADGTADISRIPFTMTTADDKTHGYSMGAQIGMSGFLIGGRLTNIADMGYGYDKMSYRVGVEYKTGPWTIGTAYMLSGIEGGGLVVGGNSVDMEYEIEMVSISGSYDVSPGIKLFAGVQQYSMESSIKMAALKNESGKVIADTAINDSSSAESTIAMIGTKLSF